MSFYSRIVDHLDAAARTKDAVKVALASRDASKGKGSGKDLAVKEFQVILFLFEITKARIAPRLRQETFPRAGDSGFRPCRQIFYQNSDVHCKRGKRWRIAA